MAAAMKSKKITLKSPKQPLKKKREKPFQKLHEDNVAWTFQKHNNCEYLIKYLKTFIPAKTSENISPMYLSALYRLIHCSKCKTKYHKELFGTNIFIEWYIRLGGDLGLRMKVKPIIFLRDVREVRLEINRGVVVDKKLLPGKVDSEKENQYFYDELGDAAILAGVINPEFISPDSENFLRKKMIELKGAATGYYLRDCGAIVESFATS